MNSRIKKGFHIFKEVVSWMLLIAVFCTFVFVVYNTFSNDRDSEGMFLFGYRPVLVLTGSMEPYMMTNGLALTKEVTDISELAVGDVVTYHVSGEGGKLLRITHRIVEISGPYIFTKGDNNQVSDGFALTMENIEAKVIGVTNVTAWLAAKWQTTAGKVMIISFGLGAILLYFCIKMLIQTLIQKRKGENGEEASENVIDVNEEAAPAEVAVPAEAPVEEAAPVETEPVQDEVHDEEN